MTYNLNVALWNANGLQQHRHELETFLIFHKIDILLISETHFTHRNYIKIPNYKMYDTKHPDGTAHGGTAIIIKNNIKHHESPKHEQDFLQATTVVVEDWNGPITISAIYCPPRHNINRDKFYQFFSMLGNKFIAGGDYNAKNQVWGSRLTTTRGRELRKAMLDASLNQISSGEPTYWPTDRNKTPDLLDFCVTRGISSNYINVKSCFDLSSDHSPVLISIKSQVIKKTKPVTLCNKDTNWNQFRSILCDSSNLNISLKTQDEIDSAVQQLNNNIQTAAWQSTTSKLEQKKGISFSAGVRDKIAEKRRLRKNWQISRSPNDKLLLNQAVKDIKKLLQTEKNLSMQHYLENLTPTDATDYSLWKATKKLKQPQQYIPPIRNNAIENSEWARTDKDKADMFANHLADVFQPFPSIITPDEEATIINFLETPFQMDLPIKKFKITEVKNVISELKDKKAPGFELITGKILKELPDKCVRLIMYLFNAILRLQYFPMQWKVAQIIMIQKPGKNANEVQSYRPISLLPILSKLFEKLLLKRLKPLLSNNQLIPNHQFGFRNHHSTIEQIHRVVDIISKDLERKKYCSTAFLDISQAFDKVWHSGLLFKIKSNLPPDYYMIIKSYIENRQFFVKIEDEQTKLRPINAGVPQGSVLGPLLYLLFTADLPTTRHTKIATFADDTAILSSHRQHTTASMHLQEHLDSLQTWLNKWRIKANETKSTHVTFTMNRNICPPVSINNRPLPQSNDAKYLGMHLDQRLTWKKHIFTKRKQLGLKLQKMYWLMGKNSSLSLENKILLYKSIIKPIWTYGIQLWGTASNSNIEILQRFQSKVLRIIVNAPWYVPNILIQRDLKMTSVKDEIKNFYMKYENRLSAHPNELAVNLLDTENDFRRLKRFKPSDLSERF